MPYLFAAMAMDTFHQFQIFAFGDYPQANPAPARSPRTPNAGGQRTAPFVGRPIALAAIIAEQADL